jgi:hypothetical protein
LNTVFNNTISIIRDARCKHLRYGDFEMFRSTITFIAIICSVLCFVGAVLFFAGQSSGNATAEAVGFATLGANFGAMVLSAVGLALGSGWWIIR